ncbi:MAG: hypothetical protein ACSHXF_08695 [Aquaticitalea sp.]
MKSPLLLLCCMILLVACKNDKNYDAYPVTDPNEPSPITLEGAWELDGFYNYVNNKVVDSFNTREGYRQVKIYTPTKVMWSKHVPTDSTEWFGYGSYSIEENNLKETLDYGSEMMSKIIEERKEFIYELDLKNNRFSQIEIDEEGNRIYSENYRRIE